MIDKTDNKEGILPFYSGSYGFFIRPDDKSQEKVVATARELAANSEFVTRTPHVSLYHAKYLDLPKESILKTMRALKTLAGKSLTLKGIHIYGGKFIFWDVEMNPALQKAHEVALETSKFLDPEGVAKALEEGLNLSTIEVQNIKKYGHPLVLDNYLPHITLAYDNKGIKLPKQTNERSEDMQIEDVNFVQTGLFGSIKQIVF